MNSVNTESVQEPIVCTHKWFLEATVRIGGSDPYFQYRCLVCRDNVREFTRKKDVIQDPRQYSNIAD